ncbi:bis(5'-adenosyl)-triphosphatase enpp4 [Sphaeramia orbicularis]|uniref:bis(5'-adenosyl)-triphosphatase n=1 Tax=Sphaeramia orbicularis TaxID=375764 RepID=A0A672YBV8_9TELE|nr:bis(5'-adenosyl)-triphosphatase ENPP4 [Sphaeramia orbicularis]XP_030012572.1 bis(5'-adenosyl)-triphosphatase ENPP4 [Sphaeramia orbicularis]
MLLKILLLFLCGVRAVVSENSTAQPDPPPLLLVSFDGFRADYLQRFPMPNLKRLYSQGVLVKQLTNVFVTKTFPNHYSLVTGLYAESHGIVASNMYDPNSHKYFHVYNDSDPMWWSEAQPIWITAQDYGYKTASMMWPGSDVVNSNRTATHFFLYNDKVTFKQRLGNVTNWLVGDKEQAVKFAALYWEEPDRSGHKYGPDNTTAMREVLKEVDDNIGLLISELQRVDLWGKINVVVVSDHGMAQCSPERLIQLDDCLHPDNYTLVDHTPVAALIPKNNTKAVFDLLSNCHPHMTAYLKKSIPDKFHYRNNERIQPIILVADEGWTIIQRGNTLPRLGDHGYDNSLPSMHPFLAAAGPSFRQGYEMSSLQSVDVYPLLCRLLEVTPRPNNGTLSQARCMLAAETCWDVALMAGMVVGVLLALTVLTVLLRFATTRRRTLRPFRRIPIEDDDDDSLLE